MTSFAARWCVGTASAIVLSASAADAQPVAHTFEELVGTLSAATLSLIVTDMEGQDFKGELAALSDDSISLILEGQTETFTQTDVAAVRASDGVGDGALMGAGAGLGIALGVLAALGSGEGYVLPSAKVGAPLLLSGVGAVVGALVDRAHHGGRLLYAAPGQTQRTAVLPIVGHAQQGVLVSVSF